jgi:hypothetical protein
MEAHLQILFDLLTIPAYYHCLYTVHDAYGILLDNKEYLQNINCI